MDKVKIGIIGLGGRGLYFGDLFGKNSRSEVVALSDVNPERLEFARGKWKDSVSYYTNNEEMLSREDIDAVVVATSDNMHKENALEVFKYKKHLLLEKPMAQSIEDCDEIIKAWKEAGSIFMIGLELRYCLLFTQMKDMIDSGEIGDVKLGMAIDNVSVGGNYYYHNRNRRKDFTRSLLLQKGCHTIDLVNWFMGARPVKIYAVGSLAVFGGNEPNDKRCRDCNEKNTCPYSVNSEKFVMDYGAVVKIDDRCVYAEECDTNDNSQLIISYDNGTSATFTECHFTPEYTREFTFIGTKGKMYGLYNNEGNFKIDITHRHTGKVDEYRPIYRGGGHGGGDQKIVEDFLDCILEGKNPVSDVIAARDSTAVAAAAEESIEKGVPVEIPECMYL